MQQKATLLCIHFWNYLDRKWWRFNVSLIQLLPWKSAQHEFNMPQSFSHPGLKAIWAQGQQLLKDDLQDSCSKMFGIFLRMFRKFWENIIFRIFHSKSLWRQQSLNEKMKTPNTLLTMIPGVGLLKIERNKLDIKRIIGKK